jgi:DNA mismatch repair protein MutL
MPEDLANQIAAGEVVERPASAVKELVENALDAGATRIRVELERGGLERIRIVDDGCGMTADDARLCIERHATSKLTDKAQLFAIGTFGFRGEALPSIASVSRFALTTKPHGALGGTRVRVDGGVVVEVADAGCPPGTEIEVQDLFFNTPARLKFLKQETTELRHVTESVQRIALAHPNVHITVAHNGRTYLDFPRVTNLAERLLVVLGRDDASMVYPLEPAEQDGVRCTGFFGQPTLSRRTSATIWTFVNGRFVRDKTVMSAIRVGYDSMIDRGRYPVALLELEVALDAVDVNVHPMKTEVRFHDTQAVFRAVRRSIAQSVSAAPWVPLGAPTFAPARPPERSDAIGSAPVPEQVGLPVKSYSLHRSVSGGSASRYGWSGDAEPVAVVAASGARTEHASTLSLRLPEPEDGGATFFQALTYLGHLRGTYLLAADAAGLVVVDQHAAHERITFEVLRLAWRDRRTQSQPMLVPQVLELDPVRAGTLTDALEFFARLGFEIEPFGGTDFALKAAPAVLTGRKLVPMIYDTLDELAEHGNSDRLTAAVDAILVRMACHGSIRAGDTLTADEVFALFRDLDRVDFGANCPHGRPVYFRMSIEELETRFERR